MSTEDIMKRARDAAVAEVNYGYEELASFYREDKGTTEGAFVDRAMAWHADKEKHQWLWCFMRQCVDTESVTFLGSLGSFCVNVFRDDTYFYIDWYVTELTDACELLWNVSEESNPSARPRVNTTGDGQHDPALLLAAMDEIERREMKRMRDIEEEMGQ